MKLPVALAGLSVIPLGLAAFFGGALLLAGLKGCDAYNANKQAEWKHVADSAATVRVAKLRAADSANFQYQKVDTTYLRGRDVLLNPPPGQPPASPQVRACFVLSDALRTQCQIRHDADTAALHATERELTLYQNKPDPYNPRLTLYGEALYDLIHQAPVFRAGAQFRIGGGISATAAGDLAIPPAGQSGVTTRALVGIRYNFR